MKLDSENFEELQKIMALKRYEQPPPGYLHHLPGRIMSRIERGEKPLTFWEKLSANFALRPSVAYAFGLTVFGAVALSAFYTVRREPAQAFTDATPGFALQRTGPMEASSPQFYESQPLHVANWLGNTNPANPFPGGPSLFAPTRRAIPVSFEPAN